MMTTTIRQICLAQPPTACGRYGVKAFFASEAIESVTDVPSLIMTAVSIGDQAPGARLRASKSRWSENIADFTKS